MTANIHAHKILIIDFGSQYCQLIARRVREIGVYCEIYPFDVSIQVIKNFHPRGIILSGGPETVTTELAPKVADEIFDLNIPILGICYGMQTMAAQLGGRVGSSSKREFGHAPVINLQNCVLLKGIEDQIDSTGQAILDVWMSHGDKVLEPPKGFEISAKTNSAPIAAIFHPSKPMFGLQFHPEVTHTPQGKRIIERFVSEICACRTDWTTKNIIHDAIETMRTTVGQDKVLLGLSGGVDSSVVAALLHEAIGDQLTCVFVDNGLLRLNEAEQVMQTFAKNMGIKVIHVDASQPFLSRLQGIADPEEKRKIIGHTFIDIFNQEAQKLSDIRWLAQGTIYPDVVESAATKYGKAHVIKSHHNVGGLPEDLPFQLLEPLRELFKDEVREMGLELGLPYDMVYRHPFPGPGLGVRILGEIKSEYADLLRQADHILIEELHHADLYHKTSQAFAVFLPVKSVGVMGDARKYEYVIAIRVVETIDFMTAKCSQIPYEILFKISNRIVNEVDGISRVTYDISSKPPATIEWE